MMSFRLVPDQTNVPFLSFRKIALVVSCVLALMSVVLLPTKGLNFGIDFKGGTMIEARMPGDAADIGAMRVALSDLGLGEVALQEFGTPVDVLIRVEEQEDDQANQQAVTSVKQALADAFGEDISYRRVETVGAKVSDELYLASAEAVLFALIAILAYIWFRFEWQFAVGSIVALVHDVLLTLGIFSLLGLEFNLATVAALLTIVGYSLNDTVVVYDRVRENLRKYKKMLLPDLLDRSLNDTLARTLMTSVTTLLALAALYIFGGPVIRDFTFALIWGVLIGTYSSIFIASPILLFLNLRAESVALPSSAEKASP
ncbi:MAG: protein translocase subunit SecF [Pseudomonadota bacterium]